MSVNLLIYIASSGKHIAAGDVDVLVRALSMGKLHHAMMGTAAVAIATAAAIPGTLKVGAEAEIRDGNWTAKKAIMSRSARVLMERWVRVPEI